MGRIGVDTAGLAAVGQQLAAAQAPAVATGCVPAAADPTSLAVAAALSAHDATLTARLLHAGVNRAVGGAAVIGTAATFEAQDAADAGMWAVLPEAGTVSAPDVVAPPPVAAPTAVPEVPAIPPIPTVAAGMPGQVWSALIHGGPGSGPLRALAAQLRATAAQATQLASATRQQAGGIDAAWEDAGEGDQQAGANTARLADWYGEVAGYADAVASHADSAGGYVDSAQAGTPRPEVFTAAQQRLTDAWSRFSATGDPFPVTAAVEHLTKLEQTAATQQGVYAAGNEMFNTGQPLPPPSPPVIAGEQGGKPPKKTTAGDEGGHDDLDDDGDGGKLDTDREKTNTGGADDSPDDGAADLTPTADDDAPGSPPSDAPGIDPATDTGAPPPPPTVPAATAAGPPAEMLGQMLGQGLGQAGQLGQSMPNPTSALSGLSPLSSMPSMGQPEMPSPEDMGMDSDGLSDPFDFGPGSTSPSSSGGPPGMSAGPFMPGRSNPAATPTIGTPPVTSGLAGGPASAQPGMGMGRGMGMMPMMGGMGGNPQERDKSADKRVVHKEIANTEPVFGEVERQRQRRPSRATQKETNSDEQATQ